MFGYVLPNRPALSAESWAQYQAAYCGLCHALRRQCGGRARYILNYDFTFLALLLEEETGETRCVRCPAHPIKGRPARDGGEPMALAAGESVILTYYKLLDAAADERGTKRLAGRLGAWALNPAFRRAAAERGEFADHVRRCLEELRALEEARCDSLDRTADTFARLLQGAAPATGRPERDRPMAQLLYHLGRWIYLVDAYDDLEEDGKQGRYNPIAARFGGEVDKEYLQTTLRHTVSMIQSAFQLLDRTPRQELLENILYLGLPMVQEQVFAGTWKQTKKTSRSIRQ